MALCPFCMRQIKDDARFCPHCGKDLSAATPPHHLPPGTVLRGKYRLGAALGEGGFGITYVGLDTALDLRVAIKEFFPYGFVTRVGSVSSQVTEMSDQAKAAFFQKGKTRFMQEARVLAKFSGARGIVDVRDFFEENKTAYIVMEYLDGVTLKQYLKERGTLSPEETLRLLTPVMESLKLLHRENVIHRDISPDNIMLTDGEVKLLDFGAARSVDGDNKSLSVMLKPGYAPEEQYRSKGKQGPWTDVYALCATMYKCITDVRLDESPDRLYNDTMKAPSALGVSISPAFEQALLKGLAVRAEDRWQTVDALLAALQAPTAEEPKKEPGLPPKRPDLTQTAPAPLLDEKEDSPTLPVNKAADKQSSGKQRIKLAIIAAAALAAALLIVILIGRNSKKDTVNITDATTGEATAETTEPDPDSVETITFGEYQEEAIEWLILKKDGKRALVISKYALDCQPYNVLDDNFSDHTTWEKCSLRTWLNSYFYYFAFNEEEQSRIQSVTVTADKNPDSDTDPGNDTTDNIFLLSIKEANEFFASDEERKCEPTAFTKGKGAITDGGCCIWWLRSPGRAYDPYYDEFDCDRPASVDTDGKIDSDGSYFLYNDLAIRPAMWIELPS